MTSLSSSCRSPSAPCPSFSLDSHSHLQPFLFYGSLYCNRKPGAHSAVPRQTSLIRFSQSLTQHLCGCSGVGRPCSADTQCMAHITAACVWMIYTGELEYTVFVWLRSVLYGACRTLSCARRFLNNSHFPRQSSVAIVSSWASFIANELRWPSETLFCPSSNYVAAYQ